MLEIKFIVQKHLSPPQTPTTLHLGDSPESCEGGGGWLLSGDPLKVLEG